MNALAYLVGQFVKFYEYSFYSTGKVLAFEKYAKSSKSREK